MHQVGDEIPDLIRLERGEQAFGHHRDRGGFLLRDFRFLQRDVTGRLAKGQCTIGLRGDRSGEKTTVLERQRGDPVIGADRRTGIDDILKDVVEVRAPGAGQIRADGPAVAVELVASAAEGREKLAAFSEIGLGQDLRSELRFELVHLVAFLRSGIVQRPPDFGELLGERGIFERSDLSGAKCGERGLLDRSGFAGFPAGWPPRRDG